MNRDKKRTYILSALVCALLLLSFFIPIKNSGLLAACILVPAVFIVFFTIKKRLIASINKRQVLLIVGVSGLLHMMLHYLLGLHFGMAKRSVGTGVAFWLETVLPIVLIIISSEIIRNVLLAQKSGIVSVIAYFICFASDILIEGNIASLNSFNNFMDMLGLTVLSAVTSNLLYQYLSKRYGALPGTVLRLLLALYPVLISTVPLTPDAIVAFIGLVFPLVLYLFVDMLFERKRVTHKKTGKVSYISMGVVIILMLSVVMIVSCQFRFGALVIGSESMTGELNVGDAAVYERYDGQIIQEGDVVVFRSGGTRVIHRVVDIDNIGGELR